MNPDIRRILTKRYTHPSSISIPIDYPGRGK